MTCVSKGHVLAGAQPLTDALILILTGVVAAFLNTAASSGSAVSLPIMIMIGVGPVVANASNRLPIVIGCATAVWTFHRAGHLPWRDAVRFAIPVAIGAVAGASLASVFDDMRTTNLVIFAVVVAVLLLFANPSKWLSADRTNQPPNKGPLVLILMGCVGVWAGLIAVDSGTTTAFSDSNDRKLPSAAYCLRRACGQPAPAGAPGSAWQGSTQSASGRHRPTPPATERPPAH